MQEQGRLLGMVDILRPLMPHEVAGLVRRSACACLEVGETFDMAEDRLSELVRKEVPARLGSRTATPSRSR